ncbi:MAG TPA: hypothetical protein VMZ71_08635 [Gemmataceae bacterium]|nr:hypothetical protein [Gemmataceae bacterium]
MRSRSFLRLECLETRETPSSTPVLDPYGNPLPPPTDPGPTQPPPPTGGGSTGPYTPPPGG